MWFIKDDILFAIKQAYDRGETASEERALEFSAAIGWGAEDIYSVAEGVGVINVAGVLTKSPRPMAAIFGGGNTTYAAIEEALALAEADENVKEITLSIDSPGGQFDGLFETVGAIAAAEKPVKAVVDSLAASAAYAIAASADSIEAVGKTAQVGSIGVVVDMIVFDDEISITNRESPDKRPDPRTEEGIAVIQDDLDAAFELFAEAIADGRGVDVKTVAESYGRGRVFFAEEALSRGMVDNVETRGQNTNSRASGTSAEASENINLDQDQEVKKMDLEKLKAEHPELVQAIIKATLAGERDRVNAHLIAGTESGDMATAVEAIQNGEAMTETLRAKYMAAGMKKNAIQDREDDNVDLDGQGEDLDQGDELAAKDAKAADDILAKASEFLSL